MVNRLKLSQQRRVLGKEALAPFLFVICMEYLNRLHKTLEGIQILIIIQSVTNSI